MTATYPQAVDQMQALFNAAWLANAGAVAGYVPDIEWPDVTNAEVDRAKAWVRFSSQNVYEERTSLSTCVGEPGLARYTGGGLAFVQVFVPKTIDNGNALGRSLADVAKKAFRGKTTSGKLTFRNARVVDVAPEELFYRFNAVVEYEFDDIG
jgi:hypothetical protein